MEFLITQVPMGVIPPYIIDSLVTTYEKDKNDKKEK